MCGELKSYLDELPKGLLHVRPEDGSSIVSNALSQRIRKHLKSIGVAPRRARAEVRLNRLAAAKFNRSLIEVDTYRTNYG